MTSIVYQGDSRQMDALEDESVDLVITSPPYWNIKDYGNTSQIGWGQSFSEYLSDLNKVWKECLRVLRPGCRLCINVGDMYQRKSKDKPYKVIPIHSAIVMEIERMRWQGEQIPYFGSIIWEKISTTNTTGGGKFMGSYPYPKNGMVTYNFEYIAIFRKPGKHRKVTDKSTSAMTKEEWSTYFSGIWKFNGIRQQNHMAMFPLELPSRLIKMFSFKGETVLDPFTGSGTTLKAAHLLGRNGIGYEIGWDTKNESKYWDQVIREKIPEVKIKKAHEHMLTGY